MSTVKLILERPDIFFINHELHKLSWLHKFFFIYFTIFAIC